MCRSTRGAPDSIPLLCSSTHDLWECLRLGRHCTAQSKHPCPQVLPFFLCLVRFWFPGLEVPALPLPRILLFNVDVLWGLTLTPLFVPQSLLSCHLDISDQLATFLQLATCLRNRFHVQVFPVCLGLYYTKPQFLHVPWAPISVSLPVPAPDPTSRKPETWKPFLKPTLLSSH